MPCPPPTRHDGAPPRHTYFFSQLPIMAQAEGWERLGELSRLLQSYRHMYVRREVEEDNPSLLNWRHELVEFLKVRARTWRKVAVWPLRAARRLCG